MKQQFNVYNVQNYYLIDIILSTKCLATKIFRNENISLSKLSHSKK